MYFITGDFPLAIAEYRRSSVLDPSFIFSHIQLAVAEYKQGEIVQALNHFEGLLKEHPTSGEVANYYGELLLDQGKFERAVEMFERSLALSKDSCVLVLFIFLPMFQEWSAYFILLFKQHSPQRSPHDQPRARPLPVEE